MNLPLCLRRTRIGRTQEELHPTHKLDPQVHIRVLTCGRGDDGRTLYVQIIYVLPLLHFSTYCPCSDYLNCYLCVNCSVKNLSNSRTTKIPQNLPKCSQHPLQSTQNPSKSTKIHSKSLKSTQNPPKSTENPPKSTKIHSKTTKIHSKSTKIHSKSTQNPPKSTKIHSKSTKIHQNPLKIHQNP